MKNFGESSEPPTKQFSIRKTLIALGVAATISVAGYIGWKTDWWQEVLCKNEVVSESGLVTITRDEYSCDVRIDVDIRHGLVRVGTGIALDTYSTNPGRSEYLLEETIHYDLRGHEGRLVVSPIVDTDFGRESEILTMYIPDFCEDVR